MPWSTSNGLKTRSQNAICSKSLVSTGKSLVAKIQPVHETQERGRSTFVISYDYEICKQQNLVVFTMKSVTILKNAK